MNFHAQPLSGSFSNKDAAQNGLGAMPGTPSAVLGPVSAQRREQRYSFWQRTGGCGNLVCLVRKTQWVEVCEGPQKSQGPNPVLW